MHQLSPNTIIKGKKFSYTIKKVLGQGTFGITYLATVKLSGDLGDLDGNIQVCLKEFFMEERKIIQKDREHKRKSSDFTCENRFIVQSNVSLF